MSPEPSEEASAYFFRKEIHLSSVAFHSKKSVCSTIQLIKNHNLVQKPTEISQKLMIILGIMGLFTVAMWEVLILLMLQNNKLEVELSRVNG